MGMSTWVSFAGTNERALAQESLYQKAAEVSPHSYDAQVALASLYLGNPVVPEDKSSRSRTNFGLAEQHARTALDLNADRIDAYRLLAEHSCPNGALTTQPKRLRDRRRLSG
jgi:hypothetical protein